ncbi:MAG TPA: ankyrin repeat domain-containing protein [Gemmatimonadaceae bacterium]|nr:ankyrin repeat domain-containing protein [Gemmatimonadaceae bacterium]
MQQQLPASPDLDHLRKQAKSLLKDARAGDTAALQRFIDTLPATRGADFATLATRELKLHDAQSVIAREYGCKSWTHLSDLVRIMSNRRTPAEIWVLCAYSRNPRTQHSAQRAEATLLRGDPWVACAIGDVDAVRNAIAANASWVNTPGGPHAMPPLVAVTHSRFISEPDLEPGLLDCATLLIDAGANLDVIWSEPEPPQSQLSALYGATGITHNTAMAKLLLDAGASPDDNESLYHSLEFSDSTITRLLLQHGARVSGTNALARSLDFDKLDDLRLLLDSGGDANERPLLHHAILRGRSLAHIRTLLDAGANPRGGNEHGVSVFRFAMAFGRTDIVELLREVGVDETLDEAEEFIAACARADAPSARAILSRTPNIVARLSSAQLKTMPELASTGNIEAVRTMLALGWPREIKTAWDATALNLAVYRGDAVMAALLLDAGADWRSRHGYNDNVFGTLSFASQDEAMAEPAPRDYIGCARTLLEHGAPAPNPEVYSFSDDVADFFAAVTGVRYR